MSEPNSVDLAKLAEKVVALEGKISTGRKSQRQTDIEQSLNALAKLGGKLTAEEDIIFEGKKLILPENMKLREAINFLQEKEQEDEKEVSFSRTFKYRPWDGAHATMAALRRQFGAVAQRAIQSFWGDQPPALIDINIGPNEITQVPWGRLGVVHLPGLSLYLDDTIDPELGKVFVLHAVGPRKYRHHVEGMFMLIEKELQENSIYRGKPFDGQRMPQFLDLSGVDPGKVVYSESTLEQLDANIWSVLRWPDVMQELGMPLKRAVLLEGPYGTGKTLAAYLTAKIAVENGWSFLLCRPGQDDLMDVMQTARLYQPAVVFFEDVDSISSAEKTIPRLLDIFDGIKAKGTRILAVLTTNHVERIHKGMVRPGRLDAVIHVGALDSSGFRRLVEAVVPEDKLSEAIDWVAVSSAMDGFLPAFAKEAIDRAMRYNIAHNQGKATELSTADFVAAAEGLRPQLELMEGAKDTSEAPTLERAFNQIVARTVTQRLDGAEFKDYDGDYVGSLNLKGA